MSLCATEAHGDAVLPGPVAASGQAVDLFFLDVRAGWKNKEKKEKKRVFTHKSLGGRVCLCVKSHSHKARHPSDEDADVAGVSGLQAPPPDSQRRTSSLGPSEGGDAAQCRVLKEENEGEV